MGRWDAEKAPMEFLWLHTFLLSNIIKLPSPPVSVQTFPTERLTQTTKRAITNLFSFLFFFFKGHCWFWHKTHALSFKCTYLPWHVAFVTALTRQLGFGKKMRVSICTICSKADSASQYSMETKEKDYIVRDNVMFNFRRIYAFPFSGMPVLTLKQHN